MLSCQLFVVIFVITLSIRAEDESDPVVCLENFCIKGKNFDGNLSPFEGFLGIPYAKPPVDDLRLRDPQPLDDHEIVGLFNATEEKEFCMQKNYLFPNPQVMGSEDCLYLYVYRPKNLYKIDVSYPVVVYIHGGAFFAGTGGPSVTGADYFMDSNDVIFVTMNYRLGPLGFLSTGDSNMPGNFGLKDQALAIEWVRKNIKFFGGDDSKITLMGQSAGASSVHLHMMSSSEWARDSFQRAVMLSGNGNGPYAYVIKNPSAQAREFAKYSKIERYNELDTRALANELRTSKPEDLLNASDDFKYWSVDPMTISRPVIENCGEHKGFLCDDPMDLWKNGDYAKVPFLSSFMDNDGGVRALAIMTNEALINDLNKNYMELLPKLMEVDYEKSTERYRNLITKKVEDKYFNGHFQIRNDSDALMRLYNDRAFVTPFYNMFHQHVKNDESTPSYMFKFSFQGPVTWAPVYTGSLNNLGYNPIHADELVYMLKAPVVFQQYQNFPKDSELGKFRAEFVEFLTYFADHGSPPEINGKELDQCRAAKTRNGTLKLKCSYIEFKNNSTISYVEMDSKIADFWNSIDEEILKRRALKVEAKRINNLN